MCGLGFGIEYNQQKRMIYTRYISEIMNYKLYRISDTKIRPLNRPTSPFYHAQQCLTIALPSENNIRFRDVTRRSSTMVRLFGCNSFFLESAGEFQIVLINPRILKPLSTIMVLNNSINQSCYMFEVSPPRVPLGNFKCR